MVGKLEKKFEEQDSFRNIDQNLVNDLLVGTDSRLNIIRRKGLPKK